MGSLTDGSGRNREGRPQAINHILEILKHPLRREVLVCLVEASSQTMTVDDLVDRMEVSKSEVAKDRQDLTMQLFHVQLPKLAQEGAIEFDPRSGLIRYQSDEDLESWLGRVREWTSE